MKKCIFLFLLSAFILGRVTAHAGDGPEKLKLATYHWPPYQMMEKEQIRGLAVERVKCILKKISQPVSIFLVPYKRAQELVKQGEYHGFFAAAKDDDFEQFAVRSLPIADQKWNWYTMKSRKVDPMHFFFKEQSTVSAIAGSDMRNWLEDNGYMLRPSPRTTVSLFRVLELERVDAVLASEAVARQAIEQLKFENKINATLARNKPLSVYFSKQFVRDYPDFLEQFNARVAGCR